MNTLTTDVSPLSPSPKSPNEAGIIASTLTVSTPQPGHKMVHSPPRTDTTPTPRPNRLIPSRRPSDIARPNGPGANRVGAGNMVRRVSHDPAMLTKVIPRRTAISPNASPSSSSIPLGMGGRSASFAGQGSGSSSPAGPSSASHSRRPDVSRASFSRTVTNSDSSRPTSPLSARANSGITTPPRVRPKAAGTGKADGSRGLSKLGSSRTSFHMSDSSVDIDETDSARELMPSFSAGTGEAGSSRRSMDRRSSTGSQDSIGRSHPGQRRVRRISSGGLQGPGSRRLSKDFSDRRTSGDMGDRRKNGEMSDRRTSREYERERGRLSSEVEQLPLGPIDLSLTGTGIPSTTTSPISPVSPKTSPIFLSPHTHRPPIAARTSSRMNSPTRDASLVPSSPPTPVPGPNGPSSAGGNGTGSSGTSTPPGRPPISIRRRLSRATDRPDAGNYPNGSTSANGTSGPTGLCGLGIAPPALGPAVFPHAAQQYRRDSDSDFMPATEGSGSGGMLGMGMGQRRRPSYQSVSSSTSVAAAAAAPSGSGDPVKGSPNRTIGQGGRGLTIDTSPPTIQAALPSNLVSANRRVVSEKHPTASPMSALPPSGSTSAVPTQATHNRTRTLSTSTTSYHTSNSNASSPLSAPSPPVPPRNPLRKVSRPLFSAGAGSMRSMQSDNTDAGSEGTFHTVAVTLPGGDGRGSYDAAGEGVYGIEVADDQAVDSPFPMSALDSTREGGQYVGEHPFDINNDDHRYSHLSQASIPSIPSLPTPNAPTFPSIPAALVASRPDSDSPPLVMRPPRADGNEPETGTGTEQGNMDIPDSKRASGDYSWGKKRQGRILDPRDFDLTGISPEMQSSMSALTRRAHEKNGSVDLTTAPSSPVSGSVDDTPPRTPVKDNVRTPSKSSSMPMMGLSPSTLKRPSAGELTRKDQLLPPLMMRSPTSPNVTRPSSGTLSKRAYLIREIASSERAYANDLALVRDAYIGARPASLHSNDSLGAIPSPIAGTTDSARSSVYTQSGPRRTSQTSSSASILHLPNATPPLPKSPSGEGSYFGSMRALPSPRNSPAPRGKPLAPADVRAVFLNIDQLAMAADELASEFEKAIPEHDEGEDGSDRLGQVFSANIARLRTLFTLYCSRQSAASSRLVELQADPGHAAYLSHRWDSIKSQTHAWNLDSMLIKPVQRITKYPLLFDDLLSQTTPVHPDYFSIRNAAEQAKAVASEIDEMKRRKDLVAGVLSGKERDKLQSGQKTPKRGLKLFKREKEVSTTSLASALLASASEIPLEISRASLADFKDLMRQFEDAEQVTKRTGKQVVLWTAGVREFWLAQDGLAKTWGYVVRLEDRDPVDKRLVAFRGVVAEIGTGVWQQLNGEVKDTIMPVFSRMLEAFNNPRKIIQRRNAKESDYARFASLVRDKKHRSPSLDRPLLDSVRDFSALHSQLVEELPLFLEGYGRMLDMTLMAFAKAQTRYYASVRRLMRVFEEQWVPATPGVVDTGSRGIVKAWHDSWAPYNDAMGHFGTKLSSPSASSSATLSAKTAPSPVSPRMSSLRPIPARRASADRISFGLPKLSPAEERIFDGLGFTPSRPLSTMSFMSNASSLSRGPSYRSAASALGSTAEHADEDAPLDPDPNQAQVPLPRLAMPPPDLQLDPTTASLDLASPTVRTPTTVPTMHYEPPTPPVNRPDPLGDTGRLQSPPRHVSTPDSGRGERSLQSSVRSQHSQQSDKSVQSKKSDDAGEGWRGEKVLYQCVAVADFAAQECSKRYRKLRFLPVASGDVIDVYYEVGRIDELPSFPYPEIGVENDGILVGKTPNGDIGLVICSFLEPLAT